MSSIWVMTMGFLSPQPPTWQRTHFWNTSPPPHVILLRVLLSDEISMKMKTVMKVFLGYDYFVSILLFCGSFLTWTKFWRHIHETHAECGRYHKVWPANIDECNVYFCSLSMYVALTPWCAISTILCLTTSGSGRPLTKTPPSWLTPPWPAVRCYQSGHGSYCV